MSIYLYNTLTRKKEVFDPIQKEKVGIYACGPTVYWFAHIGNMRTYIFSDILRRLFIYHGFDVKFVMNITDVGHLTDDEDAGEDKMIVAMKREGKTAYEIADFYTKAFSQDLKFLHILPASVYPKATDHIVEQIEMIQQLEQNGFTYTTSDGIYFDTSKLSDYGILSRQKAEEKQAGIRIALGEKRNPTDFALWKFSPIDHQRDMEWEAPWGKGFPGWHIECSAMSKKYLGIPFDIHTGGVDHIAVHHENEIAQTQAAQKCLEANLWMHGEFLTIDGGKMSKSLGNIYTIQDLIDRKFDPLAYRYFVLQAHYRTKLNFTFEALLAAQNALHRLYDLVQSWQEPSEISPEYEKRFKQALDDDLSMPKILALIWELVADISLPLSMKSKTLLAFDEVLGLGLEDYIAKPLEIPEELQNLINEREKARQAKDYKLADLLRIQITQKGFILEDTDQGQKLRKGSFRQM